VNSAALMESSVTKLFFQYFTPLFVLAFILISCDKEKTSLTIPYPLPPPIDSIKSFLPGIVSRGSDSVDFNAAFSPDGKSFYFARSQNGKWNIFLSHYVGENWTKAVKAPFNIDNYSMADPAFGPDGALYFISDFPKNENDTLRDFDIWFVKPTGDGAWTNPENLQVLNTDSTEYYISFAGNGNLYFASSRSGGYGMEDIYVSTLVDGKYSKPENVGPQINSEYSDHDPCLPKNERFMIYTSVDRDDSYGEGDLYLSIKDDNENWSKALNMGSHFNTSTYEYCSYFSPDMQYFFYSSRLDVKWTRTESLPVEAIALINH
jgi:Tol biopolymer transport system component